MALRVIALLCVLAAAPLVSPEPPRLGVLVVVDQLAARDFDARLPSTTKGFRRLAAEGFRVRELQYLAAPTITSVGHTTLVTGAWPEVHGIVGNTWWDDDEGRAVASTEDEKYQVLGRPTKKRDGTSPRRQMSDTIGDALKSRYAQARCVSISGKDRSGILMGGRSADLALWLDNERPGFTSSTYYVPELPDWVTRANDDFARAVPVARELVGKGDDDVFGERLDIQAQVDRTEVDLALAMVRELKLGADETPDLLTVSFSGHDKIGHAVGPDAPEALAEFMNVDLELGRLLDGLDSLVGKGRYVVALASDHGVGKPTPVLSSRRIDSGRVDGKAVLAALEKEADAALGPGDWFTGVWAPGFYATPAAREKLQTILPKLKGVARSFDGVLDVYSQTELAQATDDRSIMWRRGQYRGRSPMLVMTLRPYWLYGLKDTAGHATAYRYDRSVPLIVWGAGVKKGELQQATAVDLAPTFSALLQAPPPAGSSGRVLTEALK